jgi:microcompartment protein CcmK/EutM
MAPPIAIEVHGLNHTRRHRHDALALDVFAATSAGRRSPASERVPLDQCVVGIGDIIDEP